MKKKKLDILVSKINGVSGCFLHGWSYFSDNLDEYLVLEIYVNNQSVGVTVANLFEKELLEKKIDNVCHGFVFKLPDYSLQDESMITIRVANTSYWLYPCFKMKKEKEDKVFSQVYSSGGGKLVGWAVKPSDLNHIVNVSLYYNNKLLKIVKANKFFPRIDPLWEFHGFDVILSSSLLDGKKHSISLYDDEGIELNGSPVIISEYGNGINELLKKAKTDVLSYDLLSNVIKDKYKTAPFSMGMEYYSQWYEISGRLKKEKITEEIKFYFILSGDNSTYEDIYKTLSSIEKQSNARWEVISKEKIKNKLLSQYDYVAIINSGDHLPENLLSQLAKIIVKINPAILYTDSDQDTKDGGRSNPFFKPDWNYEYFTEFNYIGDLFLVRGDLINIDELNDYYNFLYGSIERCLTGGFLISHYGKIGYHYKKDRENIYSEYQYKRLQLFLNTMEGNSIVNPRLSRASSLFKINRVLSKNPLVSLIIPTRNKIALLDTCLKSILNNTTYPNIEIIVVDNFSNDKKSIIGLKKWSRKGVKVIEYKKPFNYSSINNFAVNYASGEIIGLINNDIEVITPNWLEEMLGLLLRPGIGAVGAKLLWANGMVQHGGVLLGIGGLAGHFGNHLHDDDNGYMYRNQTNQELSAVTAACLLVRKKDYLAVGGLNEFDFPVAFNDVDFCLKLKEIGLRNIWSAHAKLLHYESLSRGRDETSSQIARAEREKQNLKRKWGDVLNNDPHYNPNFNLDIFSALFTGLRINNS